MQVSIYLQLYQMKKLNLSQLLVFVATMLFISSCSTVGISQRRYNKGFNIEFAWQHKDQKQVKTPGVTIETPSYIGEESNSSLHGFDAIQTQEKSITTSLEKETTAENTVYFASKKEAKKELKRLKKEYQPQSFHQFNTANAGINNATIATTMASKAAPKHTSVAPKYTLVILIFIGLFFSVLPAWVVEGGWTINTKINLLLYITSLIIVGAGPGLGLSILAILFIFFLPFFHLLYLMFS